MINRIVQTSIFFIVASLLWFAHLRFPELNFLTVAKSVTAIAVLHLIFKVILEFTVIQQTVAGKVRYALRKTISLIYIFILCAVILRIWIPDSTALIAAYGFFAAAIAFSLQDLFKNFFGGILLLVKGVYKVGDRISVKDTAGDVIDIGILNTSVLEMQAWVNGDQPTGRIVMIPNGHIISHAVYNYTDDHDFIWDEIHIPVTFDSDWQAAQGILQKIVSNHTKVDFEASQNQIYKLQEKYFLTGPNTQTSVYIQVTDNWISLYVRYIVSARKRRSVNSEINQAILEALESERRITIASQTMTVTTQVKK